MATSMASDELVYNMSTQEEGNPIIFVKKDWLSILDNMNQSYQSNQCVIDTSQLSNSNKYMSYSEANLILPLLITMTQPAPQAAGAATGFNPNFSLNNVTGGGNNAATYSFTPANWSIGLKNWLGSIIHSFTVDMNGTTIVQATSYVGLYNTFMMMTSFSYNDFTEWANIGFYPDQASSAGFASTGSQAGGNLQAAASPNGIGSFNNINAVNPINVGFNGGITGVAANGVTGGAIATNVTNIGFLNRQAYWNFDPAAGTFSGNAYGNYLYAGNTALNQMYKSYIFNKVNTMTSDGAGNAVQLTGTPGVYQQAIVGIVKLKHLHSFFQEIPLMKGVFFKLTANLNQSYFSFTKAGAGSANLSLPAVTSPLGGVNMLAIASAKASPNANGVNSGSFSLNGGNLAFTCSIAVGGNCLCPTQAALAPSVQSSPLLKSVMLNIPSYTFNPIFETSYLSQPVKTIIYNDLYQYYVQSVPSGSFFNQLVTNGIAGIQGVLVLPYYTAAANGGISPLQSPYGMEGCGPTSPLCTIGNFNISISGAQVIYQTEKYSYEQFVQQLYGCNAVNGGLSDGVNSGLIDQTMFDQCYNYYYVNCARKLPVEQSVPMSVNITGQNLSGNEIMLYIFVIYQTQVNVDVLTGARV